MASTNFPKTFPLAQLQALVKLQPRSSLPFAEWLATNRDANFAMGCLLTYSKNFLPADLDAVKAPSEPILTVVEKLLAAKGELATQRLGVITPDEAVYCIVLCQDHLTQYSKWQPEPEPEPELPLHLGGESVPEPK